MSIRLVVLGSGSAGNATCIEGDGTRILLDAGFSRRELVGRLEARGVAPHRIDGILITHEHADHVRGAASFSKTYKVPVYCTLATWRAASLDRQEAHAHRSIAPGASFAIGGLTLTPFAVPHDAADTVGFAVDCGGARVGYATDLGHAADAARDGLRDCDLLVLESNHDVDLLRAGPYPEVVKRRVLGRHGHLDNDSAAALACDAASDRTQRIVLAHLSRTNNRPGLALDAARASFARAGRRAPALEAAAQAAPSPWYEAG